MIPSIYILSLSVWIVFVSVERHDEAQAAQGFYSFFEPRFKVDRSPRGCVARDCVAINTPTHHLPDSEE